jgi:hypothetical protein
MRRTSPPGKRKVYAKYSPERESRQACLLDLPPMGVSAEAVVSDGDLALVRDMGSHPGNELQVVHTFEIFGLFALPVDDPAFPFIQGEAFQGQTSLAGVRFSGSRLIC